jgi:membrane protease YdiL (CAAX protease family)
MPLMSTARKYLEVLLCVALWMTLGWAFHLEANAYLLLGVPLLLAFQLGLRRQPLRTLWARDAISFRLDWIGVLLAGLLMIVPAGGLFFAFLPQRMWVPVLWEVCAMAGAVCAAFALRQQRASQARRALPWFAAAVLIGAGIFAANALTNGRPAGFPPVKSVLLVAQFLSYFAVLFVLEEAVFRGALDSHLCQPSSGRSAGNLPWLSAIFVSVLWGLWHLPMFSSGTLAGLGWTALQLIVVHTLVGVPLSFAWRTGGTLVLPAAAHALIDAYRNVIQ